MNEQNCTNISMDSELMAPMRADMDSIINRTLKTMHSSGNGEAVVTAKIKITLNKEGLPTKDGVRPIIRPTFEHEVQSVVQAKDKKTGSMTGDYELVYDPETDSWIARSTSAQVSMFDTQDSGNDAPVEAEGYIEAPIPALPEPEDEEEPDNDGEDTGYEADEEPDYEEPDEGYSEE